jgi:hypothetical protein
LLKDFIKSSNYHPGIFILVSDGLDPELPSALRTACLRGHEVIFLQILSDFEINPEIEGDLRLIDSESGKTIEITAHSETLQIYKKNLENHCMNLENSVTKFGGYYVLSVSQNDVFNEILKKLKVSGVIK